jgi:hypothetical protein
MRSKGGVLVGVIAVAAMAVILSAPGVIQAQSKAIKANIPFGFYVGDTKLPAGTYMVRMHGDTMQITDDAGHIASVLSNAILNRDLDRESRMVFNRYGETWFLSEVRWQEYGAARGLNRTPGELELARTLPVQRVVARLTR